MLLIYGTLMPVRLLEEIQLWKNQEKEHAATVPQIVPQLEPSYIQVLNEWEHVFAKTEETARQWLHDLLQHDGRSSEELDQQIELLLKASIYQSEQFIQQMDYLKQYSQAARSSPLAGAMIAHFIRESYVFLSMVQGVSAMPLKAVMNSSTEASETSSTYNAKEPKAHIHNDLEDAQTRPRIGNGWQAAAAEEHAAAYSARRRTSNGSPKQQTPNESAVPIGGHTLPPLPYAYEALEPYMDAETMRLHHDKHHQSYVDGLNKAELALAEARRTGNFEHIKALEGELAFHGAGHYLHSIFWKSIGPHGGGAPQGILRKQLDRDFGGYDAFKTQFSKAAETVEGGGWAILVWSPRSHRLEILQAEKHQNLSQWDVVPLLALDVWEHAYYLKHQNKRADYIKDWWQVVNWPAVSERFLQARELKWKPY